MSEWHDDSGEYPSDAALERIKSWPYQDAAGCFEFVKAIWHWDDWAGEALRPEELKVVGAEDGDRFLRLATGGWSGNEDIVSAINHNVMIRALTWRLTARGGLHIYQFPSHD